MTYLTDIVILKGNPIDCWCSNMEIKAVKTRAHFRDFLQVPFQLYQHNPDWVPPLQLAIQKTLDKNNPFFKTAVLQSWVAYRDQKPVGRISGIFNQAHNIFHNENTAFWGFFESENNHTTAAALFAKVEQWAALYNAHLLRGPVNPSTNYDCGLQISAFDSKAFVMMPQNPAFYPDLVERQGYKKVKDLHAWLLAADKPHLTLELQQMLEEIQVANHITVRNINMKNYSQEVERLFDIYNNAWETNWGFVPISREEFFYMTKQLKALVVPQGIYILEINNEPAAFCMALPDINQALIYVRDGKLFPTGWLKLLWHTKIKNTINQIRIVTLGIKKKYQHLPLGAIIYNKCIKEFPKLGYQLGECSWILEDNRPMRSALRILQATNYKTYRIYEKSLAT